MTTQSLAYEFEQFVLKLFEFQGAKLEEFDPFNSGLRVDFVGTIGSVDSVVEVKFYRSDVVAESHLSSAMTQLEHVAENYPGYALVLVVSAQVEPGFIAHASEARGVIVIGRNELASMAAADSSGELSDELFRLLGMVPEYRAPPPIVSAPTHRKPPVRTTSKSELLGDRLRSLVTGKDGASAYEDLMTEVLKYLFDGELQYWREQSRTDDGLSVRDLTCSVRSRQAAFWRFVEGQLRSQYVVFEFKNYSEPIAQGQVLTTEKYLFGTGLRNLAIICSRFGASESARKMVQGAMREHGKLIVVLADSDVHTLLADKEKGLDPSDRLFAIVDEFLLTLGR